MHTPAARRLQQYIDQTQARLRDISPQVHYGVAAAARDLGITRQYLHRILHREQVPSWELACDIERRTRGAIRAAELVPHHGEGEASDSTG